MVQTSDQNIVAVVPMRAGSKGLPGKNIHRLAGKPLYQHTLDAAAAADVTQTIITTDLTDLDLTGQDRVSCVQRAAHLALDTTPMAAVLSDLLTNAIFDDATIVLLQVTSPLRQAADILGAISMYDQQQHDLVMSVCEAPRSVLKYGTLSGADYVPMRQADDLFANRQELPAVYRPNGSVYVFSAAWYRANGSLATDKIGAYLMTPETSIDIDTLDDLAECEKTLTHMKKEAST